MNKALHGWRRLTAGVAGALLLATAAGAHAQPDTIRIGVATAGGGDPITWGGSPGSVARVNRWLEEAFAASGVKVEWLFFKGAGPAVNEALSNRQIDFAYQGDLPSVVGRANGLDTRLLLVSGARNNLYVAVPAASPLKSVDDLKGHTVALFRGTNGHLVAINVLAARKLAERDLKIVNLDTGSAQAAIVSNGVEAAFGGIEYFKLRDQGLVKLIYSTQKESPAYTRQAALLVRGAFAQAYPAATQQVVDGFVRAARWASDEANRDALFKLWARSGIPYDSFKAEFQDQALRTRNSPLVDPFIIGRYKAVVADALKQRLIRREVSVDDWFDTRFLEQSLKNQGLTGYWVRYAADGVTPLDKDAAAASTGHGAAAAKRADARAGTAGAATGAAAIAATSGTIRP
ncbi:ABC transporter substrate-binding protein [Bordetella bronchialis]|uniref:ABC transporter substrate-binding protein n=1 Tax=Bordetella bronchialis TaxID=463025 RepID=UPI003D06525A